MSRISTQKLIWYAVLISHVPLVALNIKMYDKVKIEQLNFYWTITICEKGIQKNNSTTLNFFISGKIIRKSIHILVVTMVRKYLLTLEQISLSPDFSFPILGTIIIITNSSALISEIKVVISKQKINKHS